MNTENLSAFMRKEEEKLINRTKKKKHRRLAIATRLSLSTESTHKNKASNIS